MSPVPSFWTHLLSLSPQIKHHLEQQAQAPPPSSSSCDDDAMAAEQEAERRKQDQERMVDASSDSTMTAYPPLSLFSFITHFGVGSWEEGSVRFDPSMPWHDTSRAGEYVLVRGNEQCKCCV